MPIFAQLEWLKKRFPKLVKIMNGTYHYAPYLAVVGLGLSMLHQSSLGAMYGVLKARPLWYRPDISVLFIYSAVAAGMSMTIFVSMLSARLSKKIKVDDNLLERVSFFIGWMLVGYLYFRFWDALSMTYTYEPGRTEGLRLLTKGRCPSISGWVRCCWGSSPP
jgi:molybdopterin-containing oxidoreductase family membrane subunit